MNLNYVELSQLVLWAVVICIGIAVIFIYKDSIENLQRVKIRKHDDSGLPVGSRFPKLIFQDYQKNQISIIQENDTREKLLVFTASGCGVCAKLYPVIPSFQQKHPYIKVVWIRVEEDGAALPVEHHATGVTILQLPNAELLQYTKKLPYAYFISHQGEIISRDIAIEEEHLFDLIKKAG